MRVVITGAGGLVGSQLTKHCVSHGDEVFAFNHQQLDIADSRQVERVIAEARPEAVINCAAWTDVDGCEANEERANRANVLGPENLARASLRESALLITISTDYVFDGTKDGFYTQRDQPNPQSVYARSKLAGERAAQLANSNTAVVRTGFVFGPGGRNFLSTVIERAMAGAKLKAIGDSWGTPTYAAHLAARLRELATLDLPGLYHVVNSGEGTTYEAFTREALRLLNLANVAVESVTTASLNRPAPRPVNSRLRCLLSEAVGLSPLPRWQDALNEFVNFARQESVQEWQVGRPN